MNFSYIVAAWNSIVQRRFRNLSLKNGNLHVKENWICARWQEGRSLLFGNIFAENFMKTRTHSSTYSLHIDCIALFSASRKGGGGWPGLIRGDGGDQVWPEGRCDQVWPGGGVGQVWLRVGMTRSDQRGWSCNLFIHPPPPPKLNRQMPVKR